MRFVCVCVFFLFQYDTTRVPSQEINVLLFGVEEFDFLVQSIDPSPIKHLLDEVVF